MSTKTKWLDVVFDGLPGPESGRFVEVEDDQGRMVGGVVRERPDGLWVLRILTPDQPTEPVQ